jgi:oligopeptidase B
MPGLRRLKLLSSTLAAVSALRPMMSGASAAQVSPPIAKRLPHMVKIGKVDGENRGPNPMEPIEVQDDFFWIRDDTRKNEEMLDLLKAENAYTQHRTEHLDAFRKDLYDEMLSHVQEDDDTYPTPAADGYEYWSRTIKGKSFRVYLRRPLGSSEEQTILDVNEVPSLPVCRSGSNPGLKEWH